MNPLNWLLRSKCNLSLFHYENLSMLRDQLDKQSWEFTIQLDSVHDMGSSLSDTWKQFPIKVVLEGYRRCPDSHDLSECHHLYDLGRHILPPISLTVLTLTPKFFLQQPSGTTLNLWRDQSLWVKCRRITLTSKIYKIYIILGHFWCSAAKFENRGYIQRLQQCYFSLFRKSETKIWYMSVCVSVHLCLCVLSDTSE